MNVAGVDGCKKGWLMIKYSDGSYSFGVYKNITELVNSNYDLHRILIDIPIGLSSGKYRRTVEKKIRSELKHKHSSVFNPPTREALLESNYKKAKARNSEIEGKSISIQSFNISGKIAELDKYMLSKPKVEIVESHPELCFKYLNNQNIVSSRKANKDGLLERKKIIFSYEAELENLFSLIENSTKRKDVSLDDIADAICLCLVNKLGSNNKLSVLRDDNPLDEKGIIVNLAYYDPLLFKDCKN